MATSSACVRSSLRARFSSGVRLDANSRIIRTASSASTAGTVTATTSSAPSFSTPKSMRNAFGIRATTFSWNDDRIAHVDLREKTDNIRISVFSRYS